MPKISLQMPFLSQPSQWTKAWPGTSVHCVQKKVSPLKILQYHEENFTEWNIVLLKDSHMNFKQWCEVSAKYTLAFVRNQSLNKTGQKFD